MWLVGSDRGVCLATGPCGTPSFRPAPIYGVGSEPRYATVGDFNGDGKPDIVTANYNGDSVSVLSNDGHGVFIGPTNFPAGPGTQAVAVGDFNSDGKADLITANVDTFAVSLLLGDGNGNFASPINFNVSGQPTRR
jgi:hypothetical protein